MTPLRPSIGRIARSTRPIVVTRALATFSAPAPQLPPSGDRVRIVEVGPRDGLQNEKGIIPLAMKIEFIERLAKTGLRDIEAGAFVSPKWVPQMADSSRILEHLLKAPPTSPYPINYPFLVPNLKGLKAALSVCEKLSPLSTTNGKTANSHQPDPERTPVNPVPAPQPTELSIFIAATDSFSLKNTNCTIAESLTRLDPVVTFATSLHIPIRAYISVVLGCPYDGPHVSPITVADLSNKLLDMGCSEISLGDTTGMGTAPRTQALFRILRDAGVPMEKLAGHFHDTYGQALVNCAVALDAGVRVLDSSVAGLGGCPYARGATGNVATEEVVYFLQSVGMEPGVDLGKIAEVGDWVSGVLGRENGSRVGKALLAREEG
ncbi:hypothetical protein FGG08_001809 [Glutinoglossum americanum]|uniref:hydroxymethylglutaryl-CoA lyase n=1 Tax=Glutinoglossum americanum TaxID=1670608 RepID=A0A9P8IAE8_9PEZI|nr:hypothetical protein FGG08_001809 [Glutinoglossum americanum]